MMLNPLDHRRCRNTSQQENEQTEHEEEIEEVSSGRGDHILRRNDADADHEESTPAAMAAPRDSGAHHRPILLDFAQSLQWSPYTLVFDDPQNEAHFLIEEYFRCRWRLVLNSFTWMFIGVVYRVNRPDLRQTFDVMAIGPGVALVLQFALIFVDRFGVHPKEREDAEKQSINVVHEGAATAEEELVSPETVEPPSADQSRSLASSHLTRPTSLNGAHPLRQKHAQIQELFASVWMVLQQICLTYVMAAIQNTANCRYVLSEKEERYTQRDQCPFRANQYLVWIAFIPVIVGQPRFAAIVLVHLAIVATAIVSFNLHNVSRLGQVILLVLFLIYMLALTVLKYFNEKNLRKRFLLRKVVQEHRQEAEEGNRTLKEFVLRITPKHLHSKLHDASGLLTADASNNATCVVVQIHNSLAFMHSTLPTTAASVLSLFFLEVSRAGEEVGLEHIRTQGDSSVLVSGLVGSQDTKVHNEPKLSSLLMFALSLPQKARRRAKNLHIATGIAQGTLVGMPLGSSCIRYDIFGPAFTIASALTATCEKDKVHVEERLCRLAEEVEHVLAHYGEDRKWSGGDTGLAEKCEQSNNTVLDSSASAHLKIAHRSLSTCSARIVGAITRPEQPVSVSTNRTTTRVGNPSGAATSNEWIPENTGTATQSYNSLASTSPTTTSTIEFDPISAINVTHPQQDEKCSNVDEVTQVTISTGDNKVQRSVEVKKTWCTFVSEFCDPKVQEEAMQRVCEDSIFSFFLVNVFMAVFLFICCLSVVEERVTRYADDAAALSVYFVVTGLAAIVVFPLLAFFVWKAHAGNTRCRTLLPNLQRACLVAMFITLVVCHFARRSAIGDDPAFLMFAICLAAMYIGVSTKVAITFQGVCVFLGYFSPLFPFRPIIVLAQMYLTIFSIVSIVNATLVNNKVDVTLFAQLVESRMAIEEVEAQQAVQHHILASIVPAGLHYIFEDAKVLFTPQHHMLDCWGEDDVVVLHIASDQMEFGAVPSPPGTGSSRNASSLDDGASSHQPSPMHGSAKQLNTKNLMAFGSQNGSAGSSFVQHETENYLRQYATENRSVLGSSVIESVKRSAEDTSGLVEKITASLDHKLLDVVQVLGGTLVVAGPIRNSNREKRIRHRHRKVPFPVNNKCEDNKHEDDVVRNAVEDAMELVAELFASMKKRPHPPPPSASLEPSLTDVGAAKASPSFTIGVSLEQAINCLIINNNPSFELFGPAVNMAKAIADAAPAPRMAVATEKFAERAEHLPSDKMLGLSFSSGERWRLRDLGSVRVKRIRANTKSRK